MSDNDYRDVESQFNDGSWEDPANGRCQGSTDDTVGSSVARLASLSAAVLVTTVVQKRVARRMDAWDIQQDDSPPMHGPIRPHPVVSFDLEDSDTESIRRMPVSHLLDDVNSSYASSVCESVRSHNRGISLSLEPSPKDNSRWTSTGTDPIEDLGAKKKTQMVDRGCSPLPTECFDSDLDSEDRMQCASELWQFRPTVRPGMDKELLFEQQMYIKSAQKLWKDRLEHTQRKNWKTAPLKGKEDKLKAASASDFSQSDSTWCMVKKIVWG